MRGLYNFDRDPHRFLSRAPGGLRSLQEGRHPFRQEFTSRVWATGLQFPGNRRGQGDQARVSRREAPVHAGGGDQSAPRAQFPRRAGAPGDRLCFDFEWTNRNLFYDAYERSQSCFEQSDFVATGCPRRRNWRCSSRCATSFRRRSSARRDAAGVRTAPGATASCSAQASELLAEAGWNATGKALVERQGRAADARIPRSTTTVFVRVTRAVGREHAGDRHRRLDPPGRPGAVCSRARTISTSTCDDGAEPGGHADARRAGAHLPLARRRRCPARATCPAPPTRRSMR